MWTPKLNPLLPIYRDKVFSVTISPSEQSSNENGMVLTAKAALVLYSAGDGRPVFDEIVRINRVVDEPFLITRSDPQAILLLLLY